MNMLLKNNSRKKANIYSLKTVKHMLKTVIANKDAILSVDKINYGELYVDSKEAILKAKCICKTTKEVNAEGLVRI